MSNSEYDVSNFNKIISSKALDLIGEDELNVIYIGRGTCPYCRRFVKKLNDLSSKIPAKIYYIDSSNDSDDKLNYLRAKYNVNTVPGFIVSKDGMTTVLCDSSASDEEILDLMK